MTTYTAINTTSVDQDSPVTEPLLTALRDNPLAIGEGSNGAPINQALWHPYNSALVGDGNDGEFYDYATDGTMTAQETPTLTAGYDYAIFVEAISSASAPTTLSLDVYLNTAASWSALGALAATANASASVFGAILIPYFGASSYTWQSSVMVPFYDTANTAALAYTPSDVHVATADTGTKFRVNSSNTTDAGKLYLWRRRNLFGEY